MYSVIVILALLAFGGVAAYLGDILGYRLGKRRLSLFGMRPRTTARVVGIVAGILIPTVTIIVGASFSENVRIALWQIGSLRKQLGTLQSEVNKAENRLEVSQKQRDSARKEADEATEEANLTHEHLDQAEAHLASAEKLVIDAESQVAGLQAQSGDLNSRLGDAKDQLTSAGEALTTAKEAVTTAKEQLSGVKVQLDAADIETEKAKGDAEKAREKAEKLRQDAADLEARLAILRPEWDDLLDTFAGVEAALDLHTELVRGVVTKRDSRDALTDAVVALMVLADQQAEAAGAVRGENGRFVQVIWPVPPGPVLADEEDVPETRIVGYLVKVLWESPSPSHVVRVVVAKRALPHTPVDVRFDTRPNRLLFREGQAVVTRKLRPGLDQAEAFEQLWLLIADQERSEVRKQAQAAKMLPAAESGQYGQITIREIYEAAEKCADRTEPITVRIEASADAYTAGPLAIRIVVLPAEG